MVAAIRIAGLLSLVFGGVLLVEPDPLLRFGDTGPDPIEDELADGVRLEDVRRRLARIVGCTLIAVGLGLLAAL